MLVPTASHYDMHGMVTGIKPVTVLYAVYFIFLLSIFGRSNDSAVGEYLASLVGMAVMLIALAAYRRPVLLRGGVLLLAFFVTGISLLLFLKGQGHYTILLYLKIVLVMGFLSVVRIPQHEFVAFVNRTYLVYLVASTLVWLGLVPNVFYVPNFDYADYHADFILFDFDILYGIEGSPAAIDTYSAVVLIMNLFMNDSKSKRLYVMAAIFGIAASFRMTPLVAVFTVLLTYPIYKKSRVIAIAMLLSITSLFTLLLLVLNAGLSVNLFGLDVDLKLLAYMATHARSMIWEQQLEIMLEKYTWLDYILGRFSAAEFTVPTFQMEGPETGGDSLNPHNNYLLLFFRSPALFVLFALLFFMAQFKSFSRTTFPLVLLIFLAAFTNSSLIGLGNPIYLMLLIRLSLDSERSERGEEAPGRRGLGGRSSQGVSPSSHCGSEADAGRTGAARSAYGLPQVSRTPS